MEECLIGYKVNVEDIKDICKNLIAEIMCDDEDYFERMIQSNIKRSFLFKDRTYDEAKNFILSDVDCRINRNNRKSRAGLNKAEQLLNLTKVVETEFVYLTLEDAAFLGKHS